MFKKKPKTQGAEITFNLKGMHCTSCAINIDDALEELEGVVEASSSYQKTRTTVSYNPQAVTPDQLKTIIDSLGYTATVRTD